MVDVTPEQEAKAIVATCAHFDEGYGMGQAACAPCIAAALRRRDDEHDAARHRTNQELEGLTT